MQIACVCYECRSTKKNKIQKEQIAALEFQEFIKENQKRMNVNEPVASEFSSVRIFILT